MNISTTTKFLEKSIKMHNNKYDYSLVVYVRYNLPVKIICGIHGSFLCAPTNHLRGHGCPVCCSSKGELEVSKILDIMNIKYIREYKFEECINKVTNRKLPFDFFIPEFNMIIEYHGQQHYECVRFSKSMDENQLKQKLQTRKKLDKLKVNFCMDNKIKFLEISYKNFNNIEDILKKELK